MTTNKAKAAYLAVGALLTIFILYPTLRGTMREQKWGLLLSPEEVKAACGNPHADDSYKLTYVDGDRRVELQFIGANHKMYLNHVKWQRSNGGVGDISQVSRALISDFVKNGWLPACVETASQ